jgi:phosphoglycolate phosphatase-like HAD superfamily hydrolase
MIQICTASVVLIVVMVCLKCHGFIRSYHFPLTFRKPIAFRNVKGAPVHGPSSSLKLHAMKRNRYIPPSFEVRVENEEVTAYELEKLFTPDRFELLDIQNSVSKGFAGLIFNLEGSLINLNMVYITAFQWMAVQLGKAEPSETEIVDAIGLTFRDAASMLSLLPYDMDNIEMKQLEVQFYQCIENILGKAEVTLFPGAVDLLDSAIEEKNAVSIVTSLPRNIAQRALGKSRISLLLEGRIDSRNIVSAPSVQDMKQELQTIQDNLYDLENSINRFSHQKDLINAFHPTFGDRYYQNHLLKSCGRLYQSPMTVVYMDNNHKILPCAKKSGMSTIALKNKKDSLFSYRGSDKILADLTVISLKDVYQLVRNAVKQAQGPAQQATPLLRPTNLKQKQTLQCTIPTPKQKGAAGNDPSVLGGNDTPPFGTTIEMDEDEEETFRWLDSSPELMEYSASDNINAQ